QLFVNGRPFRDNFLVRAAEAGYRSAIAPGDRPSLYLDVLVQAGDVDVNVHPAKLEVRFRDRIGIERVVEDAVRHALGSLVAAAPLGRPSWQAPLPATAATASETARLVHDLFGERAPSSDPSLPSSESGPAVAGNVPGMPVMQVFDT